MSNNNGTPNIFSSEQQDASSRRALVNTLISKLGKATNTMNSSAAKECEICNEVFNEGNHCPKMLPCSHCICTICVEQLIAGNTMNCPFCRKAFNVQAANDLGTNTAFLSLLKYVNELEISLKAAPESMKGKRSSSLLRMYKAENKELYHENGERCHKVAYYVKRTIQQNSSVKESLLDLTRMIENDIYPVLAEIEGRASVQIAFLDEEVDRLQNQNKAFSKLREIIGEVGDKMQAIPDSTHIDPIMDETEEMIAMTNETIGDLKKFLRKNKNITDKIEKRTKEAADKISAVKDILVPAGEEQEVEEIDLSSEMVAMVSEADVPKYLNIEYLRTMRKPLWKRILKGRLFAVKSHRGRKRYAQITVKGEDEFCLHHLRDEPPTHDFHVIDYDDITAQIETTPGLAFLELGLGPDYLGRLFIRLANPDTTKAQHFSLLCTGEKGPSYANTNCLNVFNKGVNKMDFVVFGDYEENDGSGGKSLIPAIDWEEEDRKSEYLQPYVEGLVGGNSTESGAALFAIFLRDNPDSDLPGCFGKVEKGLEVLTDLVDKSLDVRKCRIIDCGIVFSL